PEDERRLTIVCRRHSECDESLLLGCGVRGRLLMDGRGGRAFKHRPAAGVLADEDEQGYGSDGDDDGGPGGHAGEQIGGTAGTERSLRSLAAEGAGEIGALALLQQDNRDHKERDDDVNDDEKDDHATAFWWRCAPEIRRGRTFRNSPWTFVRVVELEDSVWCGR